MDKVNGKLTVFFEEPFWVGIFERIEDGKLSVAKINDSGSILEWYKKNQRKDLNINVF